MDLLFYLESILSDFRYLFNQQNFALFHAFIFGFIANRGKQGTLTDLYQASASATQYWSFPKFLSRGEWNADAVAARLITRIQRDFTQCCTGRDNALCLVNSVTFISPTEVTAAYPFIEMNKLATRTRIMGVFFIWQLFFRISDLLRTAVLCCSESLHLGVGARSRVERRYC